MTKQLLDNLPKLFESFGITSPKNNRRMNTQTKKIIVLEVIKHSGIRVHLVLKFKVLTNYKIL